MYINDTKFWLWKNKRVGHFAKQINNNNKKRLINFHHRIIRNTVYDLRCGGNLHAKKNTKIRLNSAVMYLALLIIYLLPIVVETTLWGK